MLKIISEYIGGRISYEKKNNIIITVKCISVSSKDVRNCLNILSKYPLLTSKKICQLEHLKKCLENKNWDYHLKNRENKYELLNNLIHNNYFFIPHYFNGWVSGYVEAEGCFRFRNNKASSFYLTLNNDINIINAIKTIFNSKHKLGINSLNLQYRVSISGKPCLTLIKNHFINYPLMGNKKLSFDIWSESIL